jgi:hypothetical protein
VWYSVVRESHSPPPPAGELGSLGVRLSTRPAARRLANLAAAHLALPGLGLGLGLANHPFPFPFPVQHCSLTATCRPLALCLLRPSARISALYTGAVRGAPFHCMLPVGVGVGEG